MEYMYLLLFCLISFTCADIYLEGPCPDVKAKENFDIEAYAKNKLWYENARYQNDLEGQGECPFTKIENENGRHTFELTESYGGEKKSIKGYYDLAPNAGTSGIFYLRSLNITGEEPDHTFPMHVIDTDYDNYSVLYECRFKEETKQRRDFVWVLTRTRALEGDLKSKIEEVLTSTGYIDLDKLTWLNFTKEYCD